MPAMLEDPLAPVIYRASGEPPYPVPGQNEIPASICPRQVTLKDRITITTLLPFSSSDQVPPNLMSYLSDQLNREIETGDTYPMIMPMSVETFGAYWFANFGVIMVLGEVESTHQLFDMERNGVDWSKQCLGSFYIKPNYPGRSSHICNGGFLVGDAARRNGVGRLMGECYLDWAPKLKYTYSVFNLVYETNVASLRIWEALGFKRIGRIKGCGHLRSHPDGPVDAIMYGRDLGPEGEDFVPEERFDKIRYYLKTGEYPAGSDKHEKSRLRSAGSHYRLLPPVQEGGEEILMLKDKEVISDPQQQYEIARNIHETSHSGINKTTATIAERYHWVRIKETVSLVIKNCRDCKEASKPSTLRADLPSALTPGVPRKPAIASAGAVAGHDPNRDIERLASFEQHPTSSNPSNNSSLSTTLSSTTTTAVSGSNKPGTRKSKRRSPTNSDGDGDGKETRRPAPPPPPPQSHSHPRPHLQHQPHASNQQQKQPLQHQQTAMEFIRIQQQQRAYDNMPLDPAITGAGSSEYGMGSHHQQQLHQNTQQQQRGQHVSGSLMQDDSAPSGREEDEAGEDEMADGFMEGVFRR